MPDGTQPRATDGRWAPQVRVSQDAPTAGDEVKSFAFPNRTFNDAASHLSYFLRETEVPDIILSNAAFAFAEMRREDVRRAVSAAWRQHVIDHADRKPEAVTLAKQFGDSIHGPATLANWKEQIANAERARMRMTLGSGDVERIVRAVRAYRCSGGMPEEELAIIDGTQIPFGRDGSTTLTIAEIMERYRGREWIDEALTLSDLAASKKSDQMIELLREQLGRSGDY